MPLESWRSAAEAHPPVEGVAVRLVLSPLRTMGNNAWEVLRRSSRSYCRIRLQPRPRPRGALDPAAVAEAPLLEQVGESRAVD